MEFDRQGGFLPFDRNLTNALLVFLLLRGCERDEAIAIGLPARSMIGFDRTGRQRTR
jgi:hypothetical protein